MKIVEHNDRLTERNDFTIVLRDGTTMSISEIITGNLHINVGQKDLIVRPSSSNSVDISSVK